jgi:two-component system, OmpR family, KDP operon response regulator KdpE
LSNERILIVDDEAPIRRALETALKGHGYAIETAADGEDALVRAASYSPQLIVLDLMLPKRSGLEVLKDLRAWSDVPVLMLSAIGQEREKVRALDLGADDYLTKPFGIDELLARVRALLRRSNARIADDALFTFGDVTVDFGRHMVTKAGLEVHLTPTEFSLLSALCAEPGRVLTHRHLLNRVWGGYAVDNAQQLRVYMSYLRRKLEDDPANPQWLVTEPGIGYRIKIAGT